MKAILTVGIPCSGKTTYAEELCRKDRNWLNINRDDLRFSLTGSRGWQDYKFNKSTENLVTHLQKAAVAYAATLGKKVIISDTNLNGGDRVEWTRYLKHFKYKVEELAFPISLEEAYKRDALRANGVGREVIYDMYKKWLYYSNRKVYTPDPTLPAAVIFDVDGTLATMEGRRGPYEWDKVGSDAPRKEIMAMLNGYRNLGYKIIICSGRDGCCQIATEEWLENFVDWDEFFIRKAGDQRKDTVVKEEMFWNSIVANYNVVTVVDDRPVVCDMWRELGLQVVQVGDPHVRF